MRILVLCVLLLSLASPVFAAGFGGVQSSSIYALVDYYTWSEFQDNGDRILKESGPLYGLGADVVVDLLDGKLLLRGKGEFFGSPGVDYRGQTQIDTSNATQSERPVDTLVDYWGTDLKAELGWRVPLPPFSVEPFVGVGWRWWLRDLHDSTALDSNGARFPVSGYTEWWNNFYAGGGARVQYRHDRDLNFFLEGGAKYPFYVSNNVTFSGRSVTFRPEGRLSPAAEIGGDYRRLRVSLYYEGFDIGSSPLIPVAGKLFLQPHSTSDIFGLRVGWTF